MYLVPRKGTIRDDGILVMGGSAGILMLLEYLFDAPLQSSTRNMRGRQGLASSGIARNAGSYTHVANIRS